MAQKNKVFYKQRFPRINSYSLKKTLTGNFIFSAVAQTV